MASSKERVVPRTHPYLVDPASSHMLVSKIKPCMCKYTPSVRSDRGWLIKSDITGQSSYSIWITVVILELIHAKHVLFERIGWLY